MPHSIPVAKSNWVRLSIMLIHMSKQKVSFENKLLSENTDFTWAWEYRFSKRSMTLSMKYLWYFRGWRRSMFHLFLKIVAPICPGNGYEFCSVTFFTLWNFRKEQQQTLKSLISIKVLGLYFCILENLSPYSVVWNNCSAQINVQVGKSPPKVETLLLCWYLCFPRH